MRLHITLVACAALIALAGIARADDHLAQAEEHGLAGNTHSQGIAHSDEAPGQGSPFFGKDTQTPATETDAANDHANVKERTPK